MIRVLLVDDEKIVRKGMLSIMPWSDFGMVVVGEANNGENALAFMASQEIDLLLTDLSMPVMSGLQLMREVRQRYPHVQIVVLTLHQEFAYVQEALRLGAIDYIAKTELEKEQFEDVLGRISSLMKERASLQVGGALADDLASVEELYALFTLSSTQEDVRVEGLLPEGAVEVETGLWYWTGSPLPEFMCRADSSHQGVQVGFRHVKQLDRKSVMQLLRSYRKQELFYDYDPAASLLWVDASAFLTKEKREAVVELQQLKSKWLASEWITQQDVLEGLIQELQAAKLPPIRLARIFSSMTDEWNRLYRSILPQPLHVEDTFLSWVHFESWLRSTVQTIRQAAAKPNYSNEIQNSITKALQLIHHQIEEPLTAGEIARLVNMSSSYFSQCFKQVTGQTYNDYVRDIRLERAKEYLRTTSKTIQWIAEQIGYQDEKYFSRLFREHVGILPSEYRYSHTSF